MGWLLAAQLVFFIAVLGPAIVGIGLKITNLVHQGGTVVLSFIQTETHYYGAVVIFPIKKVR